MKALKGLVLMSLVFVLIGAVSFAQDRGGRERPRDRGERVGARLGGGLAILNRLGELDLTDEQREKIEKLRAAFEEKTKGNREEMRKVFTDVRTYRQEHPDDQEGLRKKREEMMQKLAPMREATQTLLEEVKGVLNEEQLKKFNEMVAQGGPGGRGMGRLGMGRPGMGGPGAGLPGTDRRTLGELNLTDEQKDKVKGLLQRFAEEQKQLIEKYQGLFKQILTPEQEEKLETAKADAEKRRQEMRERFRRGGGAQRGQGDQRRQRRRNARGDDAEAPAD